MPCVDQSEAIQRQARVCFRLLAAHINRLVEALNGEDEDRAKELLEDLRDRLGDRYYVRTSDGWMYPVLGQPVPCSKDPVLGQPEPDPESRRLNNERKRQAHQRDRVDNGAKDLTDSRSSTRRPPSTSVTGDGTGGASSG